MEYADQAVRSVQRRLMDARESGRAALAGLEGPGAPYRARDFFVHVCEGMALLGALREFCQRFTQVEEFARSEKRLSPAWDGLTRVHGDAQALADALIDRTPDPQRVKDAARGAEEAIEQLGEIGTKRLESAREALKGLE